MAFDIEAYNATKFWEEKPELSELWEQTYEEMTVHTQGNTPEKLLETRRPNEDENVFDYRKQIYQPITKGPINRSIQKLFRIFQNANHSYIIPEKLEEYLNEHNFHGKTFDQYIHGIVTKRMIEDPNGFLLWLPGGVGIYDEREKVEVIPHLLLSYYVVELTSDVITWAEEDPEGGPLGEYWSLTKDAFYIHTRNKNATYTVTLLYKHDLGMIPAILLGGMETDDGILESYFAPFLPFGNEAIRQYSDWQAVMVTSAFPYRTEQYVECDYPGCNGRGFIVDVDCEDDDCGSQICQLCHGTGQKPHNSPYGVFVRREVAPGQEPNTAPMIEFTSPATDILEYSQKAWEGLLKSARHAIFDDWIEEAQSGVAKIVDREDLDSFLVNISNNLYDNIIKKSIEIIYGYRDISGKDDIAVLKPSTFRIKTEQDLVDELGVLMEKKAPAPFILETIKDLTKKRFSNDDRTSAIMEFLVVYDPLFALTTEEKQMLIAGGIVSNIDARRNIEAYRALNEMVMDDPELFDKGYTKVAEMLDKKLEPVEINPPPMIE